MGIFDSLFGLDITGDGKADMLDDMLLMDLMEDDEEPDEYDDDGLEDEDQI